MRVRSWRWPIAAVLALLLGYFARWVDEHHTCTVRETWYNEKIGACDCELEGPVIGWIDDVPYGFAYGQCVSNPVTHTQAFAIAWVEVVSIGRRSADGVVIGPVEFAVRRAIRGEFPDSRLVMPAVPPEEGPLRFWNWPEFRGLAVGDEFVVILEPATEERPYVHPVRNGAYRVHRNGRAASRFVETKMKEIQLFHKADDSSYLHKPERVSLEEFLSSLEKLR